MKLHNESLRTGFLKSRKEIKKVESLRFENQKIKREVLNFVRNIMRHDEYSNEKLNREISEAICSIYRTDEKEAEENGNIEEFRKKHPFDIPSYLLKSKKA